MSGPDRPVKLVELVGATELDEAFKRKVRQRRWGVMLVTLGIAGIGLWLFSDILGGSGWSPLKVAELCVFGLLFATLSFGFTQAFVGFLVLAEGHEPLKISNTLDPSTPLAPTAVVMPVFNEDVATVFGNIRTLYHSLQKRGELDAFEFYILSDSTSSEKLVEEEMAWADLCRQTNGFGRVHYRRRKVPVNRKSGNIADFCRRWGHRHRYMVVLDADSVMTGEAVASLVRLMEVNQRAGIIQTMPKLIGADTLFGRIQQFASRLYSPLFAAGLNFWQQGSGNYWGHNAILRLAPFLNSCSLPVLPGREPLGGRILSHDFVEAALMRDAGWEVWFAYDLDGSYEGLPPNLTEYIKRDRRWCQGNLQHVWFLMAARVRPISRLHLIQGIMAYSSAPLLVLFVIFGGIQAALDHFRGHASSVPLPSAIVLALLTLLVLFGPKGLSLLHLFSQPNLLSRFGGAKRVVLGVILETLFSVLTAPLLIWFHTRFVIRNLAGQKVVWNTQTRVGGKGPRWIDALREYWPVPVAGILFAALGWWISPLYFVWLVPLLLGLWLAIPVAQVSGRAGLLKKLFQTPEEIDPPRELSSAEPFQLRSGSQFVHAILDPFYNAIHVALQRDRFKRQAELNQYTSDLAAKLFREGPSALTEEEKRALLGDGSAIARLHTQIWRTPANQMNPFWAEALAAYRRDIRPANVVGEEPGGSDGPQAAAA
jgi:membrane glycosyltransferase